MGASLTDTFSQSRTRNDQNTNTTNDTTSTGDTTPTYSSPQGQAVLGSLTGQATAPITYTNGQGGQVSGSQGASQAFGNAATTGAPIANYQQNPYVSSILSSSNALADQQLQKGEAGIRSQDYGAGDIKSLNDQGNYAGTFANQQALQNSQTQLGQYNQDQSNAMSGATGLAGQVSSQQNLAAQLLAMLRGTSQTGATTQVGTNDTSGTTSTIGHSDTASAHSGT